MSENWKWPRGKFKGVLISRTPPRYLEWAVKNMPDFSDVARAELYRRGFDVNIVEVSSHAVDRASQRVLAVWQSETNGGIGIHSWLVKKANEALKAGPEKSGEQLRVDLGGIVYLFDMKMVIPVLISVWIKGEKED